MELENNEIIEEVIEEEPSEVVQVEDHSAELQDNEEEHSEVVQEEDYSAELQEESSEAPEEEETSEVVQEEDHSAELQEEPSEAPSEEEPSEDVSEEDKIVNALLRLVDDNSEDQEANEEVQKASIENSNDEMSGNEEPSEEPSIVTIDYTSLLNDIGVDLVDLKFVIGESIEKNKIDQPIGEQSATNILLVVVIMLVMFNILVNMIRGLF